MIQLSTNKKNSKESTGKLLAIERQFCKVTYTKWTGKKINWISKLQKQNVRRSNLKKKNTITTWMNPTNIKLSKKNMTEECIK